MSLLNKIVSNPQSISALTAILNTSVTSPIIYGGTATGSTLTLQSTTANGSAGTGVAIKVGNNGATTAINCLNSGLVGFGGITPSFTIQAGSNNSSNTNPVGIANTNTGTSASVSYVASLGSSSSTVHGTIRWTRSDSIVSGGVFASIFTYNGSSLLEGLRVNERQSPILGGLAALATNATDGFVYMPTCAGTPTGVPTSVTGKVAWVYDTTNNKIYVYNGAWKATAALA